MDSYNDFVRGAYKYVQPRNYRAIGALPEERPNGTHSPLNETVDASVFNRWREDEKYRPPNLEDWAKRHAADIASLDQAVRADGPDVTVRD